MVAVRDVDCPGVNGYNTQLDNQKKISEFEEKLNQAQESYNTIDVRKRWDDGTPTTDDQEFAGNQTEVYNDIQHAESDLASLKIDYVEIERLRADPSGYNAYLDRQEQFDRTAESLEQHVNEALEGARDPQTAGGHIRELGRDIKEAWNWFGEYDG
jgi:hypothetical protein